MDVVSISQLKTNPASALAKADEYPLAVANRNKIRAYLVGKELYEKLIAYLEDFLDRKAVASADFSKGKDFETVAKKLGV